MSFKERIYKREHPTRIRAAERQALMDSHLICLRLTPDFNPSSMEECNRSLTREALEEEHRQRQNYESKEVISITEEVSLAELGSDKLSEMIASGNVGHVNGVFKPAKLSQNFAFFKPVSAIGNNVFIHGKELFSAEAAERYFSPEMDKDAFPSIDFGEAARKKVRVLFELISFLERLPHYCKSQTRVGALVEGIEELKKQFPSFIMPEYPPITEENFREIAMLTLRTMEAYGIEPDDIVQKGRFPSAEAINEEKNKVRKLALERFQKVCDGLTVEHKEQYVQINYLSRVA